MLGKGKGRTTPAQYTPIQFMRVYLGVYRESDGLWVDPGLDGLRRGKCAYTARRPAHGWAGEWVGRGGSVGWSALRPLEKGHKVDFLCKFLEVKMYLLE